jgi:hypothetical protein
MLRPKGSENKKEDINPVPQHPAKVVSVIEAVPVQAVKDKYSCGCPIVAVDATRNKKRCIKHQVE